MSAEKLTKKQLKAAQFRNKKDVVQSADDSQDVKAADVGAKSKGKERKGDGRLDASAEEASKNERKEKSDSADKSTHADVKDVNEKKRRRKSADATVSDVEGPVETNTEVKSKKRKAPGDTSNAPQKRTKKVFGDDGQVQEVDVKMTTPAKAAEAVSEEEAKMDKRYIVFVGNMSFTSTAADVAKHFSSHCNETPTVRLLTKKGDPSKLATLPKSKQKSIAKGKAADPSAPTSKGCAFVEFKSATALQKALQYHHIQFEGRTINVELTAGGGGKGDGRKEKIKKKNQDLEVERAKLHEKYVKNAPKKKEDANKSEGKDAAGKVVAPAMPQWGPKAAASANKQRGTTKIPKWAASGANAVRLSG